MNARNYDRNYDYDYRRNGAPSHMSAPKPRKSRTAAFVVAAALVAALGGAGAMFALSANHGSVQADAAAAPQTVQMQQANTDAAKQVSDAKLAQQKAENARKAAEDQAAKDRAAREQAERDAKAAQEKADQERAAREQAEQEKAAQERKAAENVATYTTEQCRCRDLALGVFNKDGQATNVKVSEITQGGGASTCYVEFDKAGQHYTVRVNADDYKIVYGSSTDGAKETAYDELGCALTTIEL